MTREDIIRMAHEAGMRPNMTESLLPELERFAELVAAHALIEPCCGNYDQCQKVCMPRAAAAERDRMCEQFNIPRELAHEKTKGNEAD